MATTSQRPIVAGIPISHPDRIVYPDLGLTKFDLVRYYETMADWMVPHVADRPLTLVHCPNGLASACLYMRHKTTWGPDVLRRVRIREKTKVGEYLVADDGRAIVALAQMGIVEIHTWNSTTAAIERPNRIVWDLDPGPDVRWPQVVDAARTVRDMLRSLGLACWVKTTGGRGLHVVAPVEPEREWKACLAFAKAVAQALVNSAPALYTIRYAKAGRERQILIDYLRNNRTNTSIAAFSSRARPGAPVSMPLAWSELSARVDPARFTVLSVPRRLRRARRDPWADYWKTRQTISDEAFQAVSRI